MASFLIKEVGLYPSSNPLTLGLNISVTASCTFTIQRKESSGKFVTVETGALAGNRDGFYFLYVDVDKEVKADYKIICNSMDRKYSDYRIVTCDNRSFPSTVQWSLKHEKYEGSFIPVLYVKSPFICSIEVSGRTSDVYAKGSLTESEGTVRIPINRRNLYDYVHLRLKRTSIYSSTNIQAEYIFWVDNRPLEVSDVIVEKPLNTDESTIGYDAKMDVQLKSAYPLTLDDLCENIRVTNINHNNQLWYQYNFNIDCTNYSNVSTPLKIQLKRTYAASIQGVDLRRTYDYSDGSPYMRDIELTAKAPQYSLDSSSIIFDFTNLQAVKMKFCVIGSASGLSIKNSWIEIQESGNNAWTNIPAQLSKSTTGIGNDTEYTWSLGSMINYADKTLKIRLSIKNDNFKKYDVITKYTADKVPVPSPLVAKIYLDGRWEKVVPYIYDGDGDEWQWQPAIGFIYSGDQWLRCGS